MPIHNTAHFYSEVYGPKEGQASSYAYQDSGSDESGDGKEHEAESSNANTISINEEAADEDQLRVQSTRGKDVTKEKPSKIDCKDKKGISMTQSLLPY